MQRFVSGGRRLVAAFLVGAVTLCGFAGVASAAEPRQLSNAPTKSYSLNQIRSGLELTVPLNKSHVLKLDQSFNEVSVGNSAIADVIPLTKKSIYILGKEVGTTNVTISGSGGQVLAVVDVAVSFDIEGLKRRLYEIAPDERIEIRPAGNAIILSGQVSSADRLRQILSVADRFAPKLVTNLLSVGGSQQVLLKVRFAEVQRSTLKDIGVSTDLLISKGNDLYQFVSGDGLGVDAFSAAAGSVISGNVNLDFLVDVLERKGLVRTLAEPNIVALSGDTASFLAGGEFPIPVAQDSDDGGTTITIEFKEFGVGLSFTPTVIGKELVNLELNSEVSSIDPTVSVVTDRIVVPGLKVRRTSTTVELLDGQSFAIAGLIQDDFQDAIRQVPGLGDLPIIGSLMRSTDYQRQQTELVVFITAYLVQPVTEAQLASPTDNVHLPSDFDLFLMGRVEGNSFLDQAAGIDGQYGYVLP